MSSKLFAIVSFSGEGGRKIFLLSQDRYTHSLQADIQCAVILKFRVGSLKKSKNAPLGGTVILKNS